MHYIDLVHRSTVTKIYFISKCRCSNTDYEWRFYLERPMSEEKPNMIYLTLEFGKLDASENAIVYYRIIKIEIKAKGYIRTRIQCNSPFLTLNVFKTTFCRARINLINCILCIKIKCILYTQTIYFSLLLI